MRAIILTIVALTIAAYSYGQQQAYRTNAKGLITSMTYRIEEGTERWKEEKAYHGSAVEYATPSTQLVIEDSLGTIYYDMHGHRGSFYVQAGSREGAPVIVVEPETDLVVEVTQSECGPIAGERCKMKAYSIITPDSIRYYFEKEIKPDETEVWLLREVVKPGRGLTSAYPYPGYQWHPLEQEQKDVEQVDMGLPRVYPNPARSHFTLESGQLDVGETTTVVIKDLMGREVWRGTDITSNSKTQIDCSDWSKGIYFVMIDNKDYQPYQKITIQ